MSCLVICDRTWVADVTSFRQGPIKSAISVTQRHRAESAGDKDRCATVFLVVVSRISSVAAFVQINRRTKGQATICFAGHCECHVDICEELCGFQI